MEYGEGQGKAQVLNRAVLKKNTIKISVWHLDLKLRF